MNQELALQKLKAAKEASKERKFSQSVDLIINLKDLDLKKTDNHVDFYVTLHNEFGKKIKICALVGPELLPEAKKICDTTIVNDDFNKLTPQQIKKLAQQHDYFIAQANVMPQVATSFGKILGPRGKMPNPKAGCVVPPKASLKPLYDRLQRTVRVRANKDPVIHLKVGREDQPDKEIADNITYLYDQVIHHLPLEHNNVKNSHLKLTMGAPVMLQ